jgi:hypothetical protein
VIRSADSFDKGQQAAIVFKADMTLGHYFGSLAAGPGDRESVAQTAKHPKGKYLAEIESYIA